MPQLPLFRAVLLGLALLPAGCASISKGVAEAVLEQKNEDKRQCAIEGTAFDGLRQSLDAQPQQGGVTKVLMVHGIGTHLPGYSNRFRERITTALGLTVTDEITKTLNVTSDLADMTAKGQNLGLLTVTRHTNKAGDKTLLFYELTWAGITAAQKEQLAYDSENNDGLKRAGLNKTLKGFVNSTVPDMLIYMGAGGPKITGAVKEATCWMLGNRWEDLPGEGTHNCNDWPKTEFATLRDDRAFFITHSLGSLITIDTIQSFAQQMAQSTNQPKIEHVRQMLRDKQFTVFMLSNQLPLLQLGRKPQPATNKLGQYCGADAPLKDKRILGQLRVIAMSDPNDILSYPVREDFARTGLDSRICSNLVNVSLNIATEKDLFGATSFADPLAAHTAYLEDDRVVQLITEGIHATPDDGAPGNCRWQEYRAFNTPSDAGR